MSTQWRAFIYCFLDRNVGFGVLVFVEEYIETDAETEIIQHAEQLNIVLFNCRCFFYGISSL